MCLKEVMILTSRLSEQHCSDDGIADDSSIISYREQWTRKETKAQPRTSVIATESSL